ncbi:hypothetical protein [Mumia zhuanghuii]|uniref:hypothetical protein n=1 Tax=Mumia zhuanghuii TaxID=2585211 RepID=UPI00129D0F4B|nr:hypothetical protein [Mumia zhuanghuii]
MLLGQVLRAHLRHESLELVDRLDGQLSVELQMLRQVRFDALHEVSRPVRGPGAGG